MRRDLLALFCALLGCAARAPAEPTVPSAREPAAETTPSIPRSEHAARGASEVERIYELAPLPSAPMLGSAEAKVRLEVCSDFECPFCAQLAPVIHELNENYGELLRIVWRNCPLPFHRRALPAAEAALEVYAQRGDAGFWAYHDRLFAHQDALDDAQLVALARQVEGVDAERVRAALSDHRHATRVRAELLGVVDAGAVRDGLATPVTFVNGRMIVGAQPYMVFEDAVERALQELPEARVRAEEASHAAYPMARLRHVLVRYAGARGADASVTRTKTEAETRARALRARLVREHLQFEALARAESECASASEGGELGRFTLGDLEPMLETALFALTPGEVSDVIETPFGYHLLLREE